MRVELEVSKEHLASQRPWGKCHGENSLQQSGQRPFCFYQKDGIDVHGHGINMGFIRD
jgi:hypothetical protein